MKGANLQGFVLHITPVRDEDLWVTLLTPQRLLTLYRFYGARHSVIQVGYKIDCEEERGGVRSLSRLRSVLHLGYAWEADLSKRHDWQQAIKGLYAHLKGVETVEPFYFELLSELARRMEKQDSKRAILEAYAKLLAHEGRSDLLERCFFCEQPLGEEVGFGRSLLGAHPACIHGASMRREEARHFLLCQDATRLQRSELEMLWRIFLQGF